MKNRDAVLGKYIQEYYKERHNQKFYVTERGFICYRIEGKILAIDEFYLRPTYRGSMVSLGFASEFLSLLACYNCNQMIGFVDTTLPNGFSVEKLFKLFGMKQDLEDSQPNYLKYTKDL